MTQESQHEIVEFKADDPEGLFAAKVSVFGNKDRNGDRVMRGAFDRTIDIWRSSGKKIPVVWSHEHKNPDAFIGYVDPNDVRITDDELIVAGKLDVKGNPLAMRAFNLLHDGLVGEWSFAYKVNQEEYGKDGVRQIWDLDLFEVGPTLIGANPETLTLATKEAATLEEVPPVEADIEWHPVGTTTTITTTSSGTNTTNLTLLETVEAKQVDNSAWDGPAAMASANTASDYRAICAGERSTGEPDERQHWALPHHKRPGSPPNANGVRNALARLPQTEGLKNAGAARAHLERHMASIRSEAASSEPDLKLDAYVDDAVAALDKELDELIEQKIGRVISRRTEDKIRAAVAQLNQILSDALDAVSEIPNASSSPEEAAAEEPSPPGEAELARRRIEQTGLFLAERNR